MPKAVISDLHGDVQALDGVLNLIGALDEHGKKKPDWWLCQLGDGIHGMGMPPFLTSRPQSELEPKMRAQYQHLLARDAMDLRCMERMFSIFDLVLLGNHEFQFVGGPSCNGLENQEGSLVAHSIRDFYRAGCLKAATSVGNWLITHAGLQPAHWKEYDVLNDPDPARIAGLLNDGLEAQLASTIEVPVFQLPPQYWSLGPVRYVGKFRRHMPPGGIFWADWKELTQGYAKLWPDGAPDDALKQLVGHTPQDGPRKASHYPLVDIDVGAGLSGKACAAVTYDEGATWQTHVYQGSRILTAK